MLGQSEGGWVTFSLGNVKDLYISWADDIGLDWLESAIVVLSKGKPFLVKGFNDSTFQRIMCIVSYKSCYIISEYQRHIVSELINEESVFEPKYYHVDIAMIEFCKMLYEDISINIDEWARFYKADLDESDDVEATIDKKRKLLESKLYKLKFLIEETDALLSNCVSIEE